MAEMDTDYYAIPPLRAIFDSAKHFGLTEDEAWQMVDECLYEALGDASMSEYLDELTGALARRILAKERRLLARERRTLSEERF